MNTPPRIFDRAAHRMRLGRAARGRADADFLRARAAEDIASRLEMVQRTFTTTLVLGARRGAMGAVLAGLGAKVDFVVESDLAQAMLAGRTGPRVVLDEECSPLAAASVDLIVSSLTLHWANDLVGALIQARRALRPDGLFIAAFLGGATLTELRQALLLAEAEVIGGAGPRVSPFADAYAAAALMQRAGFAQPVVDVDTVTVRYDDPLNLLGDLRAMGETSVLAERSRPLTQAVLARAREFYWELFSLDGRIFATFEILTVTGWSPMQPAASILEPRSRG